MNLWVVPSLDVRHTTGRRYFCDARTFKGVGDAARLAAPVWRHIFRLACMTAA